MANPAIKRVGLIEETFQKDEYGRAKATRKYTVETDQYVTNDVAVAMAEAYEAWPLPPILSLYSASRPFCRCVLQDVQRQSPTIWEISCWFEDPTSFSGTGDPLTHPANIVTGVEIEQEEYEYDGTGARVCNSSGSRFSRLPTRPKQTAIYAVTKIVNDATKALIKASAGTLNLNPITIDNDTWQAGEAWLVLGQNAFTRYEVTSGGGTTHMWTANYAVRGKRGGWKQEMPDIGYTSATGKTPKELNLCTSNPPMGWPLDGSGHFMSSFNATPSKLTFWPETKDAWEGVPLA